MDQRADIIETRLKWTQTDGRNDTLPPRGTPVIVGRHYDDGCVHAEFVAQRTPGKQWRIATGEYYRIGNGDYWALAIMENGA